MTDAEMAGKKIQAYLRTLGRLLRGSSRTGISAAEVREIVAELESHIAEKLAGNVTGAGVEKVLEALGRPEELAGMYLAHNLQLRAVASRSPMLLLEALFRWASRSATGFLALVGSLCGYFVALSFAACAVLKPVHPATAGLWSISGLDGPTFSLRLGFGAAPAGGHELLGWSVVPLGLLAGLGAFLLTMRLGLWSMRQLRAGRWPAS